MLQDEVIKELEEKIKNINKEKNIDNRLKAMIELKEKLQATFNDLLDDIFSAVNLKKRKLNLEEED